MLQSQEAAAPSPPLSDVIKELHWRGVLVDPIHREGWFNLEDMLAPTHDEVETLDVHSKPATKPVAALQGMTTEALLDRLQKDNQVKVFGLHPDSHLTRVVDEHASSPLMERNLRASCLVGRKEMFQPAQASPGSAGSGDEPQEGDRILNLHSIGFCPDSVDPGFAGTCSVEPRFTSGSGVLVGPDRVLTAAHNLRNVGDGEVTNLRFVFGFVRPASSSPVSMITLPERAVRSGAAVIAQGSGDSDGWILVQLDQPVTDRLPIPCELPPDGAAPVEVYMLGYPLGTSLTLCGGGSATLVGNWLDHSLSTVFGYSGAGVFSAKTHALLGIHVLGTWTLVANRPCVQIFTVMNGSATSERAQPASAFCAALSK